MSNTIHSRATRLMSWLLVPAILACGGALWAAGQPADVPAASVLAPPAEPPAPEPEITVVVEPAVLWVAPPPVRVAVRPAAKKARDCVSYPMYASGDEHVLICE